MTTQACLLIIITHVLSNSKKKRKRKPSDSLSVERNCLLVSSNFAFFLFVYVTLSSSFCCIKLSSSCCCMCSGQVSCSNLNLHSFFYLVIILSPSFNASISNYFARMVCIYWSESGPWFSWFTLCH